MLKVKEGFHHDLNANDTVELKGPTFPCKDEFDIFKPDITHSYEARDGIRNPTFSKKFLLACQDAATCKVESGILFDTLASSTLEKKTIIIMINFRYHHTGYNQSYYSDYLVCNSKPKSI